MREAGWGLICLGLLALVGAFLFVDVSREIGTLPYASEYLPRMPRSVANVHAMHIQSLVFHAGLASFLAGVICIGAATIDESIRRNDPKPQEAPHAVEPATTGQDSEATGSETIEPQPDVPSGGWAAVVVVTLIIVVIIAMAALGGSGGRSTVDVVTNEPLTNSLDNEAVENFTAEELNAVR